MMTPEQYRHLIPTIFREELREVLRLFVQKEQEYWQTRPMELRKTLAGLDQWDGVLWSKAVCLLMEGDWFKFISWLYGSEVSQETHVQDQMISLIKQVSPFLPV